MLQHALLWPPTSGLEFVPALYQVEPRAHVVLQNMQVTTHCGVLSAYLTWLAGSAAESSLKQVSGVLAYFYTHSRFDRKQLICPSRLQDADGISLVVRRYQGAAVRVENSTFSCSSADGPSRGPLINVTVSAAQRFKAVVEAVSVLQLRSAVQIAKGAVIRLNDVGWPENGMTISKNMLQLKGAGPSQSVLDIGMRPRVRGCVCVCARTSMRVYPGEGGGHHVHAS